MDLLLNFFPYECAQPQTHIEGQRAEIYRKKVDVALLLLPLVQNSDQLVAVGQFDPIHRIAKRVHVVQQTLTGIIAAMTRRGR